MWTYHSKPKGSVNQSQQQLKMLFELPKPGEMTEHTRKLNERKLNSKPSNKLNETLKTSTTFTSVYAKDLPYPEENMLMIQEFMNKKYGQSSLKL